jgi:hypothetical protein
MTPMVVQSTVRAAAETHSYDRASIVLKEVGGINLSAKTVERVAIEVGGELKVLRDEGNGALVRASESPPVLAVAQCDGGRIRTREPGQGPGVHDAAWRETKNACLVRMTCQTSDVDPQPELPRAFCNPEKVAELAEKEPLSGIPVPLPREHDAEPDGPDWRPKRLLRTCLSSMAPSHTFGAQMESEARQRRFFEAPVRAFLGDGLPWNWSIHREHFSEFVPILDFIHVLSYVYRAALAVQHESAQAWSLYLALARACWQGRVSEVIDGLVDWLKKHGLDPTAELKADDPRQAVLDAVRYLTNNRSRMDYPAYRRAGLPITTALMESMVKEVNYRVKGTEMFWNDPEGAEAILQIRAAALSEDDRLARYLARRPGSPFVRRNSRALAA